EIPVPGAFVGDTTPDQRAIYIGTQVGDVYKIDPVSLKAVQRFPAVQIGPNGFAAFEVRVLADGRLAMLGAQGGIPAVDGYSALAIWNPVDNSFFIAPRFGLLAGCPLTDHIAVFTLTPDRQKVLLGAGVSTGAICSYDPVTDVQKAVNSNSQGGSISGIMAPAGSQTIILPMGGQVLIFDANTLFLIGQFTVGDGATIYRYILSLDGNTLFAIPIEARGPALAFDWRTHTKIGWIPNFELTDAFTDWITPIAIDESGLIAGVGSHGVVFLDAGTIRPGVPSTIFGNTFALTLSGPVQGGTQAQIEVSLITVPPLSQVLFGGHPSPSATFNNSGLVATTPPGPPGPVDITGITTDGNIFLQPEAFTYGPWIQETITNFTTAEGGAAGTVYGYGFGPFQVGGPTPSGLQMTVGGAATAITQYVGDPYPLLNESPFPLEAVQFALPPGTPGTAVSVGVTTPDGTITAPNALQYLPATSRFPLPGSVLIQGIYDPRRNVYYFSDKTKVQVFSRTQGKWLTPIAMPAQASRLWGLSLSPNGSKLAVADAGANLIYLLNPDTPATVSTFTLTNSSVDPGEPCGLAITDAGIIYYATFYLNSTGGPLLHRLDTSSRTVVDYQFIQAGGGPDFLSRVLLSSDNARVYLNNAGIVYAIDTATDVQVFNPLVASSGEYELTLSSNQTWMSANEWLMDTNFNPESFLGLNEREALNVFAVFGAKLSPDGNLFFQPLESGIYVFDGKQGILRAGITLPFQLSATYDALVSDGKDNIVLGIVGQQGDGGVAVLDLTSLPEPLPLPFAGSGKVLPMSLSVAAPTKPKTAKDGATNTGRSMTPHTLKLPHVVSNPLIKAGIRVLP
ncbi:MAG TPA: IPT/TIG domain-containing protein, partial [Candidatus Angelobacter sp.]|nr:IPT/TIG domain-containing protein [Candidatus Angelobacter sp.]